MIFYHGKDVIREGTPVLNGIARRDTLTELGKEIESDKWHQMAMRTLSGTGSREIENGKDGMNLSTTTACVVSDSDLASSWTYTSRKEAASEVFDSQPNLELPVNSTSPSKRCRKTCCRLTVSTIITLCIIGIASAIGAIIYFEFVAPRQSAVPSLPDGDSSVKLSGHYYINGNADWESRDHTAGEQRNSVDYPDELDFKKSTHTSSSPPSRRGKLLSEDDLSAPNGGLLHAYVNGTISAMKNVVQMIKDISEQGRNSRILELPENHKQQDNFAHDGRQSVLQKLTSFLFGTVRPNVPVEGERNFDMLNDKTSHSVSYIDKSFMEGSLGVTPNGDMAELGSGEIDKGITSAAEIDLSKVVSPMLTDIYPDMRTLLAEIQNTKLENLELKPHLEDSQGDIASGAVHSTSQRATAITTEGQISYFNIRNKFSSSIAGLFQIFRAMDRISSAVTSPSNEDSQENPFQRRVLVNGTWTSSVYHDAASQEREHYLQRLRNIMFIGNATA